MTTSDLADTPIITPKSLEIHKKAYDYWCSLCKEHEVPRYHDMKPAEIIELLPNMVIFDVLNKPRDFRYRMIGKEVERHNAGSFTGKRLSEMPGKGKDSLIWQHFSNIVKGQKPSAKNLPYVGPLKDFKQISIMAFPFSDDDNIVNKIMIIAGYHHINGDYVPE